MNDFTNHYTSDDDTDFVEELDHFDKLEAREFD